MISLITPLILLILSIVILYVSGEIIIKSSVFIANVLRIPTLIIGLTVVSFATSLPEIFVSIENFRRNMKYSNNLIKCFWIKYC